MGSLIPDLLPVRQAEVVRGERGTVFIWHAALGVIVTRAEGHLSEGGARAMYVATRRIIASDGPLVVFSDWEEVSSYDREARILLTQVGKDFRRAVEVSHILQRARIVAMALHMANMVLGNIRPYTSRAAFEDVLRRTILARQTGRTTAP